MSEVLIVSLAVSAMVLLCYAGIVRIDKLEAQRRRDRLDDVAQRGAVR